MKYLLPIMFLTSLVVSSVNAQEKKQETPPTEQQLADLEASEQAAAEFVKSFVVTEEALEIHHSGMLFDGHNDLPWACLLYTSPSPRDRTRTRMPSSA